MADQPERQQSGRPVAIPDGGLGSAVPDWMQAKPEWTGRERTDKPPVVRERSVPEPDTSPILLADIVTIDDLPDWLRAVANRPDEADDVVLVPVEPEPDVDASPVTSPVENTGVQGREHPWWASDRVMAGLLIAVIVTIFFVLITAARLM